MQGRGRSAVLQTCILPTIKLASHVGLHSLLLKQDACMDGKPHRPKTIHMLLMGLQRHMRIVQPSNNINIFTDLEYHLLKNVHDFFYRNLQELVQK